MTIVLSVIGVLGVYIAGQVNAFAGGLVLGAVGLTVAYITAKGFISDKERDR